MTTWIGTSFKMTKSRAESVAFASRFGDAVRSGEIGIDGLQTFLIPSFPAIQDVAAVLQDTAILTGAQDAHWEDGGPWTGSVSVPQVAEVGARLVELGHSERRAFFGDTDAVVRSKVRAVLRHGLIPVVCVGEPAAVFEAGESSDFVRRQIAAFLGDLGPAEAAEVVIAYEPIWAIGTAGRAPAAEEIARVPQDIAREWGGQYRALIFGGGVDLNNAASLLDVPGIDGLFPGRSAWNVDAFLELVRIARGRRGG